MTNRPIIHIAKFFLGPSAVLLLSRTDGARTFALAWEKAFSAKENLFSSSFAPIAQSKEINRRIIALILLNTIQVLLLLALILVLLIDFFGDRHIEHTYISLSILLMYSISAATDFFASSSTENLNLALDSISNSATSARAPRAGEGHPASVETLMKSHSVFDHETKKKILKSVERTKGSEEELLAASRKTIEEAWSKSEHGKFVEVSTYEPKGKRS
jgi:hypothetical protein